MTFAENLAQLPCVDHIARLRLLNADGEEVATIANVPGKAGSVRIYAALAHKHGAITPAAAQEGLELFAEHTAAARAHAGSHPNIDRLFAIIDSGAALNVEMIMA